MGLKISPGRIEMQSRDQYIDSDDPNNPLTRAMLGKESDADRLAKRDALKRKLKGRKKRDIDDFPY